MRGETAACKWQRVLRRAHRQQFDKPVARDSRPNSRSTVPPVAVALGAKHKRGIRQQHKRRQRGAEQSATGSRLSEHAVLARDLNHLMVVSSWATPLLRLTVP